MPKLKCPNCGSPHIDLDPSDIDTIYKCRGCNTKGYTKDFEVNENNEVQEVQDERGKDYGAFEDHIEAVESIMTILKNVHVKKNEKLNYPKGFQTFLFYAVSKLVRLVTSPNHEDSALDLGSYSKLWLDIIRKRMK